MKTPYKLPRDGNKPASVVTILKDPGTILISIAVQGPFTSIENNATTLGFNLYYLPQRRSSRSFTPINQ